MQERIYNCIFCSSHNVFGRTYRARSPENVFKEIEQLAEKFGAEAFAFQDDEAFINKKRIIEFCNLAKKSKYPLRFSARLRIDSLDEKMLRTMKESGFKRLAFGIESGETTKLDLILEHCPSQEEPEEPPESQTSKSHRNHFFFLWA